MGCSPSKGKLFSKPEIPGSQNGVLPESSPDSFDCDPVEEVNECVKTNEKENELLLPTEVHPKKEDTWSQLSSDTTAARKSDEMKETGVNVMPKTIISEVVPTDTVNTMEKRKKTKGKRKSMDKQRKSSIIQTKVDFPPHLVRAHQAAYAFLNPNISKYEILLGMLDQAAQMQLSLRPMISSLVLHFEEINQALEEMAEEGKLMLEEHGDYMALPSGMIGPAVMPSKSSNDTVNPPDPPPDLLQHLLQQSTEKMRFMGGSVQALGDTTLEEAVEYFSSLSKLLVEKLQAKQAMEQRLTQVLAWVEVAAMAKSNPEDLALYSEDSGIGGENESLTGSERHHRGSAGSGSCGSGVTIHGTFDSLSNNLPNLIGQNEDDEEDEMDNNDDEECEDDESDRPGKRRSNSSPPDPSQPLLYMYLNYMQEQQSAVKRPQTAITATKPEHSSSTKCINIKMDLQKSQRDLDQRFKKMADNQGRKQLAGPQYNMYGSGFRRHSLCASVGGAQKASLKINQSPYALPMLAPQPPKHHSVRRLINAFSQGLDGRPDLSNIPPYIRRTRKNEILLSSDNVNGNEGGLFNNGNNNNNSWPYGRDDLDVDNLPPPPPEVLMDNSFCSTEGIPGKEELSREDSVQSLPIIKQKTRVSQRLKASVQTVEVLPNRTSVRPRLINILPARSVRKHDVMGAHDAEQQPEPYLNPEMGKANCLYQQAHKIIHLHNGAESSDKRNIADQSDKGPLSLQARMGQRCESNVYDVEISSCNLTVTAPPVSRVRLPPSCPSVCQSFSSPPVFKPQFTIGPLSCPSSPRTTTCTTEFNTEEIIPSVSFHDARSVFCQNELQNSHICISLGNSMVPRPWGQVSRGRLLTRGTDNTTRRTQSEQRSSMSSGSEILKYSSSTSAQVKGSEPVATKYM